MHSEVIENGKGIWGKEWKCWVCTDNHLTPCIPAKSSQGRFIKVCTGEIANERKKEKSDNCILVGMG